METAVKFKHCTVKFDEHFDADTNSSTAWAVVDLAWGTKADPVSVVFASTWDVRLRDAIRKEVGRVNLSVDTKKDVYLEDTWIMVNFPYELKHLSPVILKVVGAVEKEFEALIKSQE